MLDGRAVGAPAVAVCVHVSLMATKQAIIPALLGDRHGPEALARILGRLALIGACAGACCVPFATAIAGVRRQRAVAVAACGVDAFIELCYLWSVAAREV